MVSDRVGACLHLQRNAQLSRLYLHTWQATHDEFFKKIAVEIYDYILREMTSPEGGFYSTTDADSEGEEGKFFVWMPEEVEAVLTPDEAAAALAYWDITEQGNFEFRLQDLSDGRILAFRAGDVLVERAPTPQQSAARPPRRATTWWWPSEATAP